MDELLARLDDLAAACGAAATADVDGASADQLVRMLRAAGGVLRRAEGLVALAASAVESRSGSEVREERLTSRLGCRNTAEVVERAVRCDGRRAAALVRAGRIVREPIRTTTGERMPAAFPALRACLVSGAIGADALLSATRPLLDLEHRLPADDRLAADAILAAAAAGEDTLPAAADDLAILARAIADRVDQDGPEPDDEGADRGRSLLVGRPWRGLVPVHGRLMPEVAAQLTRILDSVTNPRAGEPGVAFRSVDDPTADPPADALDDTEHPRDPRTRPQRQHDALATALGVAAASGALPTIGGAAPTLVVTVNAADYARGAGRAGLDGVAAPVSVRAARHAACGGTVQRVLFDGNGRIREIGTSDRVFNAWQRRAIAVRDGECTIPGCHVPAAWCEIHHVREHARGGPTHTDNGVLLCWHHHRTIETSGWEIRMRDGVPEIRPPSWWDPRRRWRLARPPLAHAR
jgi:hypothetical protein